MARQTTTPTVLIADDSPDDCLIAMRAWEESQLGFDVRFVHDGRELLDYLYRRHKYRGVANLPWPWLILLDLNMPRKDGRKVLIELRSHPEWRHIPTVVFSQIPPNPRTFKFLKPWEPTTSSPNQRRLKNTSALLKD